MSAVMVPVAEVFAAAVQHQVARQWADAERLYRQILDAIPDHAETLHNLSLLAEEVGRVDVAIDLLRHLVAAHPGHAEPHRNLGILSRGQGNLDEAEANLGIALAIEPTSARAHLALALVHLDRANLDAAAVAFAKVLEYDPDCIQAVVNLAAINIKHGNLVEAVAGFQRAQALGDSSAIVSNNLGAALQKLGRFDEAEQYYRKALDAQPDYVQALTNYAAVLQMKGENAQALALAETAVRLAPDDVDAIHNLGFIRERQGLADLALVAYRRTVALDPTFVPGLDAIGQCLSGEGRFDEAIPAYEAVLRIDPRHTNALVGGAYAYEQVDRTETAIEYYNRALVVDSSDAAANMGLSLLLLRQGQFREGFEKYEWRKKRSDARQFDIVRDFSQPEWTGEDLAGRTLLLHFEQGLGDTIHFLRYASLIKGGEVVLEIPPPLVSLVEAMADAPRIIPAGRPLPPFDCWCSLVSLPRLFWTTFEDVPGGTGYLRAEPDLVAKWARKLAAAPGLRVGIVWQGSPRKADLGRSFPLALFEPLAAIEGIRLISLQKGYGIEQLLSQPRSFPVEALGEEYDRGSFVDTAAVVMTLDLIITCDTAIAHLAGALGRPVWIAVKRPSDWRWGLERTDSPWYRSARLFRQPRVGDWGSVFEDIRVALADFASRRD